MTGNGKQRMAGAWKAIYRAADGELVSTGTVLPARLPEGLVILDLDHEPDWSVERWNPQALLLEPRPADPAPVDRISTFEADPVFQRLTPADQAALHDKLLATFGDVRVV